MFPGFALRNAKGPFDLSVRAHGTNPVRAVSAPRLTLVATRLEFDRTGMPARALGADIRARDGAVIAADAIDAFTCAD